MLNTRSKQLTLAILAFLLLCWQSALADHGAVQQQSSADIAELGLRGELIQGGMVWAQTEPGTKVKLDGKPVKVADNGVYVFGFGRDAASESKLRLCGPAVCKEYRLPIVQRSYREQRIDGVPQRTVSPPSEETLARIRKETAAVKKARATGSERQDFASEFIWPVHGPITGVFGSRRVYNGEPRRPHYGVDIARPTGTEVVAPAAGVVTLVHEDMFYSGGTLIIDHGHGVSSSFIHLNKVLVAVGQEVAQGEAIAEVGSTGRSTGPHLDWRMNWFSVRMDPELLVGDMPAH